MTTMTTEEFWTGLYLPLQRSNSKSKKVTRRRQK